MSNKRGKYTGSKYSSGILDGCSAAELAEHLKISRSTIYYKLAAVSEILDAIEEVKAKKKNHE